MGEIRPSCGYATAECRLEWLERRDAASSTDTSLRKLPSSELVADPDRKSPLHFWQVYSLTGERPIADLVTNFYKRVFGDDEDWEFVHAFERVAPLRHHIATQVAFWVDVMGGGRRYHGSLYRLRFHHEHNARSVMNASGARRWMFHMTKALKDTEPIFRAIDPRIPACIVDFLHMKMCMYAEQFGWRFDERDFDDARAVDPDVKLARIVSDLEGQIVFGRKELGAMKTSTLRRVCKILELDVPSAVEKADLIEAMANSSKVVVVDRPEISLVQLDQMPLGTLKKIAHEVGVKGPLEKGQMLSDIARSTRIAISGD